MNTNTMYKLYVMDLSKTHQILKDEGYDCEPKGTYLQVQAEASQKMDIIRKINEARIVVLDIEWKMHGSLLDAQLMKRAFY